MATSFVTSHYILFILISVCIIFNDAYHVAHSGVFWPDAETYCNSHCGSNLASIHSDKQYNDIKTLIRNDDILSLSNAFGDDYWIGLNDEAETGTFVWTDNSDFDFATNISGGSYPWLPNQPNISSSFPYTPFTQLQQDLRWKTDGPSLPFRNSSFLDYPNAKGALMICNECDWRKLSKYIFLRWEQMDYTEAEQYCNDNFGTNLASIHSEDDQKEAVYVLSYMFIQPFQFHCTV